MGEPERGCIQEAVARRKMPVHVYLAEAGPGSLEGGQFKEMQGRTQEFIKGGNRVVKMRRSLLKGYKQEALGKRKGGLQKTCLHHSAGPYNEILGPIKKFHTARFIMAYLLRELKHTRHRKLTNTT